MIVIVSAKAERDLEAIGDFIARENPHRALSFIREIQGKCLDLAKSPFAYPLVPLYKERGIRRRRYGNYLIFYIVGEEAIVVIHVLHAAQDYLALIK